MSFTIQFVSTYPAVKKDCACFTSSKSFSQRINKSTGRRDVYAVICAGWMVTLYQDLKRFLSENYRNLHHNGLDI